MSSLPGIAGRLSGLALLMFLCIASSAQAAEKNSGPQAKDMRFAVVRTNDGNCEPTCPEWISAEGVIGAGTPALLKSTLKAVGNRRLPVVVFSSGGGVEAAMALGRLIRKNGLDIAVGKTWFVGCRPGEKGCKVNDGRGSRFFGRAISSGGYCASSCLLMLAGGVGRHVSGNAIVGVHQTETTVKPRRLEAYLNEMGVERVLLDTMKNAPATGLGTVSSGDMLATKLITDTDHVETLTAGEVCKKVPAPDNCRVFTVLDLED